MPTRPKRPSCSTLPSQGRDSVSVFVVQTPKYRCQKVLRWLDVVMPIRLT
jgi:hypothetical protein